MKERIKFKVEAKVKYKKKGKGHKKVSKVKDSA